MPTALDCSIGIKKESVFGTAVTVTQFLEFTSESLESGYEFTPPSGLRVGSRVARAGRRRLTKIDPKGSIELEAVSSGMGVLLEAAFGAVTNTIIPTTAAYQQVHTPSKSDPVNTFTIQKGVAPEGGGATVPHTFVSAACQSIEFAAKTGELLTIATEWVAKALDTATAYATPSYPASLQNFAFVDGKIYLGNTITKATTTALATATGTEAANVSEISLKWENGLDSGGFNMGGAGGRTRRPALGQGVISGELTADFNTVTLRDAHLNNTPLTLLLTFTGPTLIATGVYPVLQIHVPLIVLDGELPKSNGGEPVTQSISFTGGDSLAAATEPIYVVYRTLDTTP